MKISWGYKIAFVYIIFAAGIGVLVFKASSQQFDLVTKDYYEQELKYQQLIDYAANASKLSSKIAVEKKESELEINFPAEMAGKKKTIDFYLYCPADAKKDFRKKIDVVDNSFVTPLPAEMRGLYELKLLWEANNVKYYHEQKIFF